MSDLSLRALLAVVGTAVIAVLALALVPRLTARHGADTRHAAWSATLLLALLVPFAALLAPAWQTGALGTTPLAAPKLGNVEAIGSAPPRADTGPVPGDAVADWQGALPTTTARWPDPPIDVALLLVWAVGALLVLARVMVDVVRLVRLSRRGTPLPTALAPECHLHARQIGLAVTPTVRLAAVGSPLTWGLRGEVLLPMGIASWPTEVRRVVLLHEMAHLRRSDAAWLLVAQLGCVLHWFNPLVWRVARLLRRDAELSTDALVVESGVARSEYADRLVRLAGLLGEPAPSLSLAAVQGMAGLEGRLRALLSPATIGRRRLWHPVGWALGVTVAVTPLLAARPVSSRELRSPVATLQGQVDRGPKSQLRAELEPKAKPLAIPDQPESNPLWTGEVGRELRVRIPSGAVVAVTSADGLARVRARWADGSGAPLRITADWDEGRRDITVVDGAGNSVTGAVSVTVEVPAGIPFTGSADSGTLDADVASDVKLAVVRGNVTATASGTATIWVTEGNIEARVGSVTGDHLRIVTQHGHIDLWGPGDASLTDLRGSERPIASPPAAGKAVRIGELAVQAGLGSITIHRTGRR